MTIAIVRARCVSSWLILVDWTPWRSGTQTRTAERIGEERNHWFLWGHWQKGRCLSSRDGTRFWSRIQNRRGRKDTRKISRRSKQNLSLLHQRYLVLMIYSSPFTESKHWNEPLAIDIKPSQDDTLWDPPLHFGFISNKALTTWDWMLTCLADIVEPWWD